MRAKTKFIENYFSKYDKQYVDSSLEFDNIVASKSLLENMVSDQKKEILILPSTREKFSVYKTANNDYEKFAAMNAARAIVYLYAENKLSKKDAKKPAIKGIDEKFAEKYVMINFKTNFSVYEHAKKYRKELRRVAIDLGFSDVMMQWNLGVTASAKINKKINDEMEIAMRRIRQQERESWESASKVILNA